MNRHVALADSTRLADAEEGRNLVTMPRVPRPPGGSMTFACTTCRIVLHDGVEYTWCPRCSGEVDWVDGRCHVWICEPCGVLVDGPAESRPCSTCYAELALLSGPVVYDVPASQPRSVGSLARASLAAVLVVQSVFALFDPLGFPYLAPLLVMLQLLAVLAIGVLCLGSRELRELATDRTTRIIHGLEHATATVLEERGIRVPSARTHHGMFMLDIPHDGRTWEQLEPTVRTATEDAISRIRFGERALAYNVHCGTSYLVAFALLALAIVGAGLVAFAFEVPSGITFAATVAAGLVARLAARPAGLFAQRWLTVSTDFASAIVLRVDRHVDMGGATIHAAVLVDVIPRARSFGSDAVAPVPL